MIKLEYKERHDSPWETLNSYTTEKKALKSLAFHSGDGCAYRLLDKNGNRVLPPTKEPLFDVGQKVVTTMSRIGEKTARPTMYQRRSGKKGKIVDKIWRADKAFWSYSIEYPDWVQLRWKENQIKAIE